MKYFCLAIFFAGLLAGCGDDKGSNGNGLGRSVAFACGSAKCESASQYCGILGSGAGAYHSCKALPAGCADCSCVAKDFDRAFGSSCRAAWGCAQNQVNDEAKQITATCG